MLPSGAGCERLGRGDTPLNLFGRGTTMTFVAQARVPPIGGIRSQAFERQHLAGTA
jgi:hypothetical protein